jgi:uncharacterized secreted protein with C-terminal beta-propeller domain
LAILWFDKYKKELIAILFHGVGLMNFTNRLRRTQTSGLKCRRSLQIERLEHRLVMSGVQPTAAISNALVANTFNDQSPMMVATAAHSAVAAGFEQFKSLAEIKDFLIFEAIKNYKNTFGQTYTPWWDYGWIGRTINNNIINFDGGLTSSVQITSLATTSADYSGTNTQVAGVDETDLMETDGKYLYMVSNGELAIIDVRSASHPKITSRMQLDRGIASIYLSGDRLTLISQPNQYLYFSYGSNSSSFEITVLDISNRKSPEIVQRTVFEGNLIDSRAIGDKVYLVINNYESLPSPQLVNMDGSAVDGYTQYRYGQYRYETEHEYRHRMAEYMDHYALPRFISYDAKGKEIASGFISNPKHIYKPVASEQLHQITTVAVIDMHSHKPGPVDAISLMGYTTQVYVSNDSIYLLNTTYVNSRESTLIRELDISDTHGKLEFVALGTVAGHVLDQFSVDEYNGFLRIATTEGWWTSATNHLFVLKQNGKELKLVGSLNGLAPGERIYSARFLGNQAYVVTYQKVDPLFAIDLSDPTAPVVKGELKIPGFSNYLQSIEGGFLVGIGRDADVATGLYQDPQVSIFNVNDLANPLLMDRFTIETGRTGGLGIFDDHHVIAYYPQSHILTISVPDAGETSTEWYYSNIINDLYVFQIDTSAAAAHLDFLGKIEHDDSVLRSVQIKDKLISISNDSIEVHDITNPESIIATLVLNENHQIPPIKISPFPIAIWPIFEPVISIPILISTPLPTLTIGTISIDPGLSIIDIQPENTPNTPSLPVDALHTAEIPATTDTPITTESPIVAETPSIAETPATADTPADTDTPVVPDIPIKYIPDTNVPREQIEVHHTAITSHDVDRPSRYPFLSARALQDNLKYANNDRLSEHSLRNAPDKVLPIAINNHHTRSLPHFETINLFGNAYFMAELTDSELHHKDNESTKEWMTDSLVRDIANLRWKHT